MTSFADTSFISAILLAQTNTRAALCWLDENPEDLIVAGLVPFEFRQSVRLQVFRHSADKTVGFGPRQASTILNRFEASLGSGVLRLVSSNWDEVLLIADRLSSEWTAGTGNRTVDILNVATALGVGAGQFLSFDRRQRALAAGAGLEVGPAADRP